jgi:hypothetical protein
LALALFPSPTFARAELEVVVGGRQWAIVEDDGAVRISGRERGRISPDRAVRQDGREVGEIEADGMSVVVGQVDDGGTLRCAKGSGAGCGTAAAISARRGRAALLTFFADGWF